MIAANRSIDRIGVPTQSNTLISSRDRRIDFWRGLCLIDMVLVHLYYENVQMGERLGKILGEYSRFAAGGFVFVAGLALGAIFLPKSRQPEQRWGTYRRLWARSLRILGWQYIVAITWVGLVIWRGSHAPVNSVWQLVRSVVTFREGGDLLPLYFALIALAPVFLEICRRRWGRTILAICSICIFVFGRFHPYALAFDPQGNFPPLLWQLIFLAGLLSGSYLKTYDALPIRTKLIVAGSAWTIFALLFWCEYWSMFNWPRCPISPVFTKVPLTSAEMIRYLSVTIALLSGTDLMWPWLSRTHAASFAATLGRSTLPVYVAHTFLIEFCGWLAVTWWGMGQWQLLFVPACLLLLWGLAVALQRWSGSRGRGAAPRGLDWSIWSSDLRSLRLPPDAG